MPLLRLLLLTSAAFGAVPTWHQDEDAGVRLPVPFTVAEVKGRQQVQGLILEFPSAALPDGVTYTSGLYAKGGLPFILIWTRHDAVPPTRAALAKLSDLSQEERRTQYGFEHLQFDLKTLQAIGEVKLSDGLNNKTLVQIAKGQTVYVGFYYRDPSDGQLFEQMREGFELLPQRRLVLPPTRPLRRLGVALAVASVTSAMAWLLWARRQKLKAPPPVAS